MNWWHAVEDAYVEDVGPGDVTAGCLEPYDMVDWYIEAQKDGILCGAGIAHHLLAPYPNEPDDSFIDIGFADGDAIRRGDRVLEGRCLARKVLTVERTALNFLMHLCGVASLTRQYVDWVEGTEAHIIDTRKTIPNMRILQKYAVRCGGGWNHRMGLFDAAMLKDNHIRSCGGIRPAMERLRGYLSHMIKVEVECESMEMVAEAVDAGADVVLLDNMDPFLMREVVNRFRGQVIFEASGGVSLDTVRGVAQTGVDLISVGALTHSAVGLPLHLEIS